MEKSSVKNFYEIFESIMFAFLAIIVLVVFVFRAVTVDGDSMEPNLHHTDKLITTNLFYKAEKGDIIVVDKNNVLGKPIVKRVIATAGDTVKYEYATGYVYVNGEKLDEPYILPTSRICGDATYPLTVKEDHIFVMGDNRGNSSDSRFSMVGQIPFGNVYGKAIFRLWPFNVIGGLYKNAK